MVRTSHGLPRGTPQTSPHGPVAVSEFQPGIAELQYSVIETEKHRQLQGASAAIVVGIFVAVHDEKLPVEQDG